MKKICRLDIWSTNILSSYRDDIMYYIENGLTIHEDSIIKNAIERGEDVDAPVWECTYCWGKVSLRYATKIQELYRLWDELSGISDIFESDYREAYIPTYYWGIIKEN